MKFNIAYEKYATQRLLFRKQSKLLNELKLEVPSFEAYGEISSDKLANFHLSIICLRDQIKSKNIIMYTPNYLKNIIYFRTIKKTGRN